jgi:predicted GNAT family N-acyltransferase
MIKVVSCPFSNSELCSAIFKIRQTVFVDEQKVSREEEFDEFEKSSIHYLAVLDGKPAGTSRWRITEKGIKMERFAVLPEFRKMGVANAILLQMLSDVSLKNITIYLHAQESAVGFYLKNAFVKEGDVFVEANIRHFKMYYSAK